MELKMENLTSLNITASIEKCNTLIIKAYRKKERAGNFREFNRLSSILRGLKKLRTHLEYQKNLFDEERRFQYVS